MSTIAKLPTWWKQFIQNVCELDGRDSPEDEPDAMIATDAELRDAALRAIECELDAAHAADAPVVGYLFSRPGISKIDVAPHGGEWEKLVRQSDHLSAIAALQAQIAELTAENERWAKECNDRDDVLSERDTLRAKVAELEARQVPDGWVIDIEGDAARVVTPPDGPGFITVAQSYGRLEQRILFALAKALAAPSNPTTQPTDGR